MKTKITLCKRLKTFQLGGHPLFCVSLSARRRVNANKAALSLLCKAADPKMTTGFLYFPNTLVFYQYMLLKLNIYIYERA